MIVGGLERISLSDFPGRLAAVVFTQGCNLRCRYCHNPALVDPSLFAKPLPEEEVLRFLSARRTVLQGVVMSGGEPTLHRDLPGFLQAVRSLGMATKLDTNGTNPDCIADLVARGLIDYVALDLKASPSTYPALAGTAVDTGAILQCARLLWESGIEYEVRTTFSEKLLSRDDLLFLAAALRPVRRFVLQGFRGATTLDPALRSLPDASIESLEAARLLFREHGVAALVRK